MQVSGNALRMMYHNFISHTKMFIKYNSQVVRSKMRCGVVGYIRSIPKIFIKLLKDKK